MSEGLKQVGDLAKHITTLSIGIVTLTMTFAKSLGKEINGCIVIPTTLYYSWVCFAVALLFSILLLMGVIGNLNRIQNSTTFVRRGKTVTISNKCQGGAYAKNLKLFGYIMLLSFATGFMLVMITGFRNWN